MAKLTNKEYKAKRDVAECAEEIYTFEHSNGCSFYTSRYMMSEDKKELKQEYKEIEHAFKLEVFNDRAIIIPVADGMILQSYYTEVCAIRGGKFVKMWDGFSVTTLKHINIFRSYAGLPALSKREWIEMETI